MSGSAKLPKGYRVTVAPCRVVGEQLGARWVAPVVWLNGQIVISAWSHGLAFEDRHAAREAGKRLAGEHAAANAIGLTLAP